MLYLRKFHNLQETGGAECRTSIMCATVNLVPVQRKSTQNNGCLPFG
jgi:hypothetical protein